MGVTPGVREFYRLEANRRGWGEEWPTTEAGILAEILNNPAALHGGMSGQLDPPPGRSAHS